MSDSEYIEDEERLPRCYQCNKKVLYLFPDGRCGDCTRYTVEEIQGTHHERRDHDLSRL